MDIVVRIILLILPMYVANSGAMILGGKTPLDFGAKFIDKREFFGKGKTWKGCVFGALAGIITALIVSFLAQQQTLLLTNNYAFLGVLLSVGTIAGDLAGSFLKRRLGLKRGAPVFLLDQLDFVAGALIFASPLFVPNLPELAIITTVTLVVHRLSNYFAFKIRIKKVPW